MPIYIELANLVIDKEAVAAKYPGGIDGFRADHLYINDPETPHQEDGELFAIAAMNEDELYDDSERLTQLGFRFNRDAPDQNEFAFVNRYGGAQHKPHWLRHNSLHAWHCNCPAPLQEKAERLGKSSIGELVEMQDRGENVFGTLLN